MSPEDPDIVGLLSRCLCSVKVSYNAYEVRSVLGTVVEIPFGAPFEQWRTVCEQLLATAMQA